jgi:hypothetical protein
MQVKSYLLEVLGKRHCGEGGEEIEGGLVHGVAVEKRVKSVSGEWAKT